MWVAFIPSPRSGPLPGSKKRLWETASPGLRARALREGPGLGPAAHRAPAPPPGRPFSG